ncbi:phage capsid protein [Shigella sonnei]|nr:phage capsid protein [Shigella sonnei]
MYVTDAVQDRNDIEMLRENMVKSKGRNNFKNLFLYAPQGKADGIKIIPLSEVATKDDFFNIKKASAADLLDAHRIPFQLMGAKWHLNRSQFGIRIDHDLASISDHSLASQSITIWHTSDH